MAERVAIVTGSNKGIGLSVVKLLCQQNPTWKVYLTARNPDLGHTAVNEFKKLGISPLFHQLDITSPASCDAFAAHLKKEHGGLDVLVNNAGIAYKQAATEPFSEQASVTMDTNYFGTLNACNAFFPLLRSGARVVNVASIVGKMTFDTCSPANQEKIKQLASIGEVTEMMKQFVELAKTGQHETAGWPSKAYGMSKLGVSAVSRFQQRSFDQDTTKSDVVVNSCCPGYVDTDMTSHKGHKTPDDGADTLVYLATLPPNIDQPRGKFVKDRILVDYF